MMLTVVKIIFPDNGTGYFFDNGLLEMGPIMTYNQQWAQAQVFVTV